MTNNSTLIFLLSGLLTFAGPISYGHAASEQKASYGTRVKYRAGQKIEFPDFAIEYVGERRKSTQATQEGSSIMVSRPARERLGKLKENELAIWQADS